MAIGPNYVDKGRCMKGLNLKLVGLMLVMLPAITLFWCGFGIYLFEDLFGYPTSPHLRAGAALTGVFIGYLISAAAVMIGHE